MIPDPVVAAAGATSSEVAALMRIKNIAFRLPKQLDPNDHHVRATIVVLDGAKRVVGFIPHPEEVQGVVIGP